MSTCYISLEELKKARSEAGPESPGHLTEARVGHAWAARGKHVDDHGCGTEGARIHGEPCAVPLEPAGCDEGQRARVRNAAALVLLGVQCTHIKMEMSQ